MKCDAFESELETLRAFMEHQYVQARRRAAWFRALRLVLRIFSMIILLGGMALSIVVHIPTSAFTPIFVTTGFQLGARHVFLRLDVVNTRMAVAFLSVMCRFDKSIASHLSGLDKVHGDKERVVSNIVKVYMAMMEEALAKIYD
jgi:hypothetical protein